MDLKLDPITFEVLRHRLWSIAAEGSAVLRTVSGSPVAAEANDCNVALMTANGDPLVIGPQLMTHALSCANAARYVQREFADNPGIEPGDLFLSNDPFRCTPHQNCVVVVGPIFWEGRVIGWSGAGIHVPDVGGPVPGQAAVGAHDIYQEAMPLPPVRLVERGRVRKDIEEDYLLRSRTRAMNALDLRAKIAANVSIRQRVLEMVERYGVEVVEAAMEAVIDYTERKLRARLRELSDGTWHDTAWLDYNDRGETSYYACHLAMTKEGDRMIFDFSGSSPQARGIINASYVTLQSSVLQTVLADLCFGLPWCPAAVLRVIEVRADPGTFVSAVWPAAVSKSTSAASQTARQAVNLCLSRLFAASEGYESRVLATCQGYNAVQELNGTDQRGEPFGAPIIDVSLSGGYGARSFRDGVNVAGSHGSPHISIANVETYEYRYPLLYLARRQEPDTGGPGAFRGGVGMSALFAPHGVAEIPSNVMHTLGFAYPSSRGLHGGYPGSTNQYQLLRGSDLAEQMAAGKLPESVLELAGEREVPAGMSLSYLNAGDVYFCVNGGGGGYGDPLERDPALVAQDVRQQLVTPAWATRVYGVSLRGEGDAAEVDPAETERLRAAQRSERRGQAARWCPRPPAPSNVEAGRHIRPLTPILHQVALPDGNLMVSCRCGEPIVPLERDVREGLLLRERAVQVAGPYTLNLVPDPDFVLREFLCPGCLRLVDVEVARRGSAIVRQEAPALERAAG